MAKYEITSPGGDKFEITAPDNATPEQVMSYAKDNYSKASSSKSVQSTPVSKSAIEQYKDLAANAYKELRENPISSTVLGAPEAAISAGTGFISSAVGGLAGLARTGYGIATGEGLDKATQKGSDVINSVQDPGTYEPRTDTGKLLVRAWGAPVEGLAYAGKKSLGYVGELANGEKGKLAGEAIGEAAGQALPLLFGFKKASSLREIPAAGRIAVAGEDYTPLRNFSPVENQRYKDQIDTGTKPTLGSVSRKPDQLRFENLTEQQPIGGELRQRTIENNQGMIDSLDNLKGENKGITAQPSRVGDTVRKAIIDQQDADTGQIHAAVGGAGIGYPETGSVLRSGVKAIRDEDWAKVGDMFNKARESNQTQELVDIKPLENFLKDNKIEADTVAPVINTAMARLNKIKSNKKVVDFSEIEKRNKFGVPYKEKVEQINTPITVDDIEQLRASISKIGRNTTDGATKHWAGEITKKIDEVTEGKGGNLYREARRARYEHEIKFNQPEAIQTILGKSSETDYRHATEDLFNKSVIKGSEAELKSLVDTLNSSPAGAAALAEIKKQAAEHARINGVDSIGRRKLNFLVGKPTTDLLSTYTSKYRDNSAIARLIEKATPSDYRVTLDDVFKRSVLGSAPEELLSLQRELEKTPKGQDAINQLKLNTIDHLINGFTRGIGKNEVGQKNTGTAGLKLAIAQVGEENLRILLGDKDTNQIMKTLNVSDDFTTNSSRLRGSSTVSNEQTLLSRIKDSLIKRLVAKVPRVGNLAIAGYDLLSEKAQQNITNRQIQDALNPRKMDSLLIEELASQQKLANKQASRRRLSDMFNASSQSLTPASLSETSSRSDRKQKENQ